MISGDNFVQEKTLVKINPNKDEYYFVRPIYIWGWATWRRAWSKYDIEMKSWPNFKKQHRLQKIFSSKNVSSFYNDSFEFGYSKRINTWDVQWFFSCLANNMLCIIPPRNLVSNIGISGTHSISASPFNNMHTEFISVENLKHPREMTPNIEIEYALLKDTFVDNFNYRILLIQILDMLKLRKFTRLIYRKLKLKI